MQHFIQEIIYYRKLINLKNLQQEKLTESIHAMK